MRKKEVISILLLIIIYTGITLIGFRYQPVPAYCDGYWYIKVAQNIAKGKGMVEDVILYYFPKLEKLKEFPHPIGNYWNPLNSIILAGVYKVFGINELTPKIAVFVIDLIIVLLIFFIGKKLFQENHPVAFFSSLIYIVHPYAMSLRTLSGLPETYTTLFMVPMVYFLYLYFVKNRLFIILASIFGGLSYLSRNESGSYILLLIILFLLDKNYKKNFKYFLAGLIGFLVVISWWEIRNFVVFGKSAGEMKRNLLLCNEFFDHLCFDKSWTIKEWLSNGIVNILIRKLASFHYKIDSFISTIHWLVALFFVFAIPYNIKNKIFQIVSAYLILTYLLMGIFFSFTQRGGWHAPSNLLPYIILFSVYGAKKFVESLSDKEKFYSRVIYVFIFLYFLGGHIKAYKDIITTGKKDLYKEVSMDIVEFFNSQDNISPKIIVNDALIIHYYTDYNSIQIPYDKSLESLKKAIKYYKPEYLILTGHYPLSTYKIYSGKELPEWLTLLFHKKYEFQIPVTDGNGGQELKIYKIDYDKL